MNNVLQLLVMEMKGRNGEMDVWEKVKIEGAISRQGVRYNDLTEEQKQIVKEIVFDEIGKHINAGEPQTTIERLKKYFIERGYKEEEIEIELKIIVNVEFERKRIHIYNFYVEAKTEHTTETRDILNTCSFVAIDLISSKFSKERNEKGERLYNIYIEQKRKEEEKRRKKEERKKEMLKSIEWVNKLIQEINIENERQKEKERFLKKFSITEDFIVDECKTSNKPFVQLKAEIDLRPAGIDRILKIYNYKFVSEYEYEYYNYTHQGFSDLSKMIAKKLAKIFNGEVKEIRREGRAYLDVVTENDTIEVASNELIEP